MTTTTAAITYRKTGAGMWVAYGPASMIKAGQPVEIAKRSGDIDTVMVASIGRPFTAEGRKMVYGYLGDKISTTGTATKAPATRPYRDPEIRRNGTVRGCADCARLGRMCDQCCFDNS